MKNNEFIAGCFDVIVVGAGHAGCEAALAASRMGNYTLCLTMNLDSIALLACNPSIGGTSKGHLVREIDALGGEMGLAADDCFIQSKLLNTAKGPAVQSLRAQIDKRRYHERMKQALENQVGLCLRQGEVVEILTEDDSVTGIRLASGSIYKCKALIIATGVYLESRIIIGEFSQNAGPSGLYPANGLSQSLSDLGFELRRFKTGTPARLNGRTIDFEKTIPQPGDQKITPFSFLNDSDDLSSKEQVDCYLTYTNQHTHEIIKENIHRAPMYSGKITGTGARYCPSIEDKVVRFADRERHQLFLEPEGVSTHEYYLQGMSSSLPEDVQFNMVRTVSGLENVEIMRFAYAIEYDCIDARRLKLSLESRQIGGLFFAGQINGSSGYEEAAAQGLIAGINASLLLLNRDPLILDRSQAYIGVLIDDLVTKGTQEPYRMMTSRAEYRLMLRQDNADERLTAIGYSVGLASQQRYDESVEKSKLIADEIERLKKARPNHKKMVEMLDKKGESMPQSAVSLYDLLKRNSISYDDIRECDPEPQILGDIIEEQIRIRARYEGYIKKQQEEIDRFRHLEEKQLSDSIDYSTISALRIEARQKLDAYKPRNIGQASRISGVSPADISVLIVYLEKMRREQKNELH